MLNVIAVPAFEDNYLWLMHEEGSAEAYVVDPGDSVPIEAALKSNNLNLAGILLTHHHWDHTGGVEALTSNRSIPVYGPDSANIPQVTQQLKEGETLQLNQNLSFDIIAVPGHTLDHIAYHDGDSGSLFCGDALFAGGCGRMFEGQPAQMQASLAKLAALPSKTNIYCAHEYTQSNLRFAAVVEPDNIELRQRIAEVNNDRAAGRRTVPSVMADELTTNPFLRCSSDAVIAAAQAHQGKALATHAEVFAALRQWKDNF